MERAIWLLVPIFLCTIFVVTAVTFGLPTSGVWPLYSADQSQDWWERAAHVATIFGFAAAAIGIPIQLRESREERRRERGRIERERLKDAFQLWDDAYQRIRKIRDGQFATLAHAAVGFRAFYREYRGQASYWNTRRPPERKFKSDEDTLGAAEKRRDEAYEDAEERWSDWVSHGGTDLAIRQACLEMCTMWALRTEVRQSVFDQLDRHLRGEHAKKSFCGLLDLPEKIERMNKQLYGSIVFIDNLEDLYRANIEEEIRFGEQDVRFKIVQYFTGENHAKDYLINMTEK